jgi:hypothetical protein
VADSIGPIITSAQVVERPGPGIDTIYVAFSEAVQQQSLVGASLIILRNGVSTPITIDAFKPLSGGVFSVSLNAGSLPPQAGDSLRINPAGPLRDQVGNAANVNNRPVLLGVKQIPAGVVAAWYVDRDSGSADGVVDAVIVRFTKKVGLQDLSFLVDWGYPIHGERYPRAARLSYYGDSTTVSVSLINAFSTPPGIKTDGAMRVTPYFSSFPGISQNFPVADSAAPVIDSAVYYVNSVTLASCDTLKVAFSEPVNISQSVNPFLLSGKSASSYIFTLSRIGGAGAVDLFLRFSAGQRFAADRRLDMDRRKRSGRNFRTVAE